MHTIDILFGILALILIVTGVRRGLIGEVFRLLGLVGGGFAAFLFSPDLAAIINAGSSNLSNAISFVIVFIAVFLIILGLGWVVKKLVHLTPLGWVDFVCGGAIGLCKTVFIFWVVSLSFATFPATVKKIKVNQSVVYSVYKKLPPTFKIDSLLRLRDSLKKNVDLPLSARVKEKKEQAESLKNSVDSVKAAARRLKR